MPIINYEKGAELAEECFFRNSAISDKNKEHIKEFLKIYDVRPATKLKFFKQIKFLLEQTADIKSDMKNRKKINSIFCNLRNNISKGYYHSLIHVSKRFVRWLNDKDKDLPKGFKDIKSPSKKEQRRDLNPEDMWNWEQALEAALKTTSIQIKAAFLTQIDAGFRPSEFIDLNYGDVIIKKDIILFKVRAGKTGDRHCPCFRCVPHFLRWYENHPTKKKDDPLWIMEFNKKSHHKKDDISDYKIRRYKYYALLSRIRTMVKKAGIDKPTDLYSLRHSSCYLDKIENVPLEIAAKRHGHSVGYFTEVYARLDLNDIANRMRTHYGGEEEKQELSKNYDKLLCERCGYTNDSKDGMCFKCGCPTTIKRAMEIEQEKDQAIKEQVKNLAYEFLEKRLKGLKIEN